jgi:2-iminobutanoate/2-iminopropanoate deaminase
MRETIRSEAAAAAVGHYSQAVRSGEWIWVSGQLGLDPRSGELIEGGVEEQARQALVNLRAILQAAGSGLDRVVKATVYLVEMAEFEAVNRVYAEFFAEDPPARVCVEVSGLPKGGRVEIDAVALS